MALSPLDYFCFYFPPDNACFFFFSTWTKAVSSDNILLDNGKFFVSLQTSDKNCFFTPYKNCFLFLLILPFISDHTMPILHFSSDDRFFLYLLKQQLVFYFPLVNQRFHISPPVLITFYFSLEKVSLSLLLRQELCFIRYIRKRLFSISPKTDCFYFFADNRGVLFSMKHRWFSISHQTPWTWTSLDPDCLIAFDCAGTFGHITSVQIISKEFNSDDEVRPMFE